MMDEYEDTTETQDEDVQRTASHELSSSTSRTYDSLHHTATAKGLIIEQQPQLSSTFYSADFSTSAVLLPSPFSRNNKRKKKKKKVRGFGPRKSWRRIVCQTLVVSAIAFYALLYTTLSSNPTVVLIFDKSTASSITGKDGHGTEQNSDGEQHTGISTIDELSLYGQNLRSLQRVAATMARVYQPVPPMNWCIDERLSLDQLKRRPMGLCLLRIPHAASSTLKGINMRIATNFGQRSGIKSCIRHDTRDFGMYYPLRDKLSYLWTFVRDPTDRAMSYVGARLSNMYLKDRSRDDPSINVTEMALGQQTLALLQNSMDIRDGALSEGRGGYQLQFAMQSYIPAWSAVDPLNPAQIVDRPRIHKHISTVFQDYDFVGIVERFDESLVVMQLLLGLEPSDILYFATNTRKQWQRARIARKTFACRKPFDWTRDLLPQVATKANEKSSSDNEENTVNATTVQHNRTISMPIEEYLKSDPEWFAQNYADYVFYNAANQTLDRTILKIGLDVYSKALKEFRMLLKRAHEECHPQFTCSGDGQDQVELSRADCLDPGGTNIGCGYDCLNNLTPS